MFSCSSGMTRISIGRLVEIHPYFIINGKDKLFLLNIVQLVWGRDSLVVRQRVLVYIGHGGWIRFRDYIPINEVLDVVFETKAFVSGMAIFFVVETVKIEVPSFGGWG